MEAGEKAELGAVVVIVAGRLALELPVVVWRWGGPGRLVKGHYHGCGDKGGEESP